jgi:hypothetical protein
VTANRARCVLAVAASVFAFVLAPTARADTAVVGSSDLASNAPAIDNFGQDIPVFQGDTAGGYVLSSPTGGTITSWSFRSGGIDPGRKFVLRVVRPAGADWSAVTTSGPVAISSTAGTDAVQGPFSTSLPVQAGDRIALQAVDSQGEVPIEAGVSGSDGIRYFGAPLTDGSSAPLPPGSDMDNGQIVPIQATVESGSASPPPQPPQNQVPPEISGTPAVGQTLTCSSGSWGGTGPFTYSDVWTQRTRVTVHPPGHHPHTQFVSQQAGTGPTLQVPDLVPATSTITCTVTARSDFGSADATSPPVAVQATVPVLGRRRVGRRFVPARPAVSLSGGTPVIGSCSTGTWLHHPDRYRFFWYSGAHHSNPLAGKRLVGRRQTFRLRKADARRWLACRVIAYNAAGHSQSVSSQIHGR